jgi:hypothetical protein
MTEKKKKKKPIGFRPVGRQFLDGMPKRFLTVQEWERLPRKLRHHALKLGLYEVIYGD